MSPQDPRLIGLGCRILSVKGLRGDFHYRCVCLGRTGLEKHTETIVRRLRVILCKTGAERRSVAVHFSELCGSRGAPGTGGGGKSGAGLPVRRSSSGLFRILRRNRTEKESTQSHPSRKKRGKDGATGESREIPVQPIPQNGSFSTGPASLSGPAIHSSEIST